MVNTVGDTMKTVWIAVTIWTLVVCRAFAQTAIPPYHLETELSLGGIVNLTWELAPAEGLVEDFEDDLAQDFCWWTPQYGRYSITNGYANLVSDGNSWAWASGHYDQIRFADFSCEVELVYIPNENLSRGVTYRVNGPYDSDMNGYDFILAFTYGQGRYSVGKYVNGSTSYIVYWTESAAINITPGAVNRLKVVGSGSTFDLYINNVYVESFTDTSYPSGHVGFIQAYDTIVHYNEITCSYHADVLDRSVEPEHGRRLDEWLDAAGRPTDHPPVMAQIVGQDQEKREIPHSVQDDFPSELDEFVEYRIFRNGQQIGTSTDPFYTDQLPSHGGYQYYVTAYYDPEGESIPCPTDTVKWGAVTYSIEGVDISVPADGGSISYSAQLFNELPVAFTYVTFQTFIAEPPNFSTVHGPLLQRTFTLTPGQSINIPAMTQNIPAVADPGMYLFTAKLLYQGSPIREESFYVHKMTDDD